MNETHTIVFHTDEDYKEALSLIDMLKPDRCDDEGIEMFWDDEAKRDTAVEDLKEMLGISVDTYTL